MPRYCKAFDVGLIPFRINELTRNVNPINGRIEAAHQPGADGDARHNKVCAGCHNLIHPIGFGLEKFDAIGMRREKQKLLFFPT